MATISERVFHTSGQQRLNYEHVWSLWQDDGPSHVLKTTIERDPSNWSGGKVWRWDGTQWHLVLSRQKEELPGLVDIIPYAKHEWNPTDFLKMSLVLEKAAQDILEVV